MNDLERVIITHLCYLDSFALKFYLTLRMGTNGDTVKFSYRNYVNKYGGSFEKLKECKTLLRKLGLIVPYGENLIQLVELKESGIGKICLRFSEFSTQQNAIENVLTDRYAVRNTATDSVAVDFKYSNEINKLQEKRYGFRSAHNIISNKTNIISKYNKNNNSNITTATESVAVKENKMINHDKVLQIYESWNDFVIHYSASGKTRIPRSLKFNHNDESDKLSYAISEWIENNGDEWWDVWQEFIEKAKNNTWLQSKEKIPITLRNVFQGFYKDSTPVITKALQGLYDGWNLKINANLDKSGKVTDVGKQKMYDSMQGMKILGEINE